MFAVASQGAFAVDCLKSLPVRGNRHREKELLSSSPSERLSPSAPSLSRHSAKDFTIFIHHHSRAAFIAKQDSQRGKRPNAMMDVGSKGNIATAPRRASSSCPKASPKKDQTSTTPNTNSNPKQSMPTPTKPPLKMTKCHYCGNDSSTYACNCASEYASTSSFDKNPTSLNDPKPELGPGSSRYTGVSKSTFTPTKVDYYVGKPSGSSNTRR